jgi:hypothetical protein
MQSKQRVSANQLQIIVGHILVAAVAFSNKMCAALHLALILSGYYELKQTENKRDKEIKVSSKLGAWRHSKNQGV